MKQYILVTIIVVTECFILATGFYAGFAAGRRFTEETKQYLPPKVLKSNYVTIR